MRRVTLATLMLAGLALAACSDDDNGNNNNNVPACTDNDGDQYGTGDACKGPDCDDNDNTKWAEMEGYPDADGDGHYAMEAETVCTGDALPDGYSDQPGDDCDDTNKDVWQEVQAYVDNDGDGAGAATATAETLCIGENLPDGYSETNTDCDDGNAEASQLVSGYPDLDGDTVTASATMLACTDGNLPEGWSDTAGTDCDDQDPMAQVQGQDIGCQWLGFCVDTEGLDNPAAMDYRGIGACQSTDCNGTDPDVWEPMLQVQTGDGTPKTCQNQSECDADEYCFEGVCHQPNPDCNTGDQPCATMPDCLNQCKADHPDDQGAQFACMQACYESLTPLAQYLYWKAQDCAAEAGCFAQEDVEGCVLANCAMVFGACMADS